MQKSVLVLYNPTARKGKITRLLPYIKERLEVKYSEVDFIASKSADDLKQQAKENAGLYDLMVVAGGDGSIHLAINGVKESGEEQTMAFIPYGTVNDVCRTLKMPNDIRKALDVILKGETINYDTMKDKDNYFIYTLAGGMFVTTSFKTERKLKNIFGKLAYYIQGIKDIFKMKSLPLTITADDERYHGKFILCMLLNSTSAAGYRINKEHDIDDQLIDLVLIEKKKHYLPALFVLLRMFLFGIKSVRKSNLVTIKKCSQVSIENHSNALWTGDGEKEEFLKKKVTISEPIKIIYNKMKYRS